MKSVLRLIYCLPLLMFMSCNGTTDPVPVNCEFSTLELKIISISNSSECGSSDGSFIVEASGGSGVYNYRIIGGDLQSSTIFSDVSPGIYQVAVRDNAGCEEIKEVFIASNTGLIIDEIFTTDAGCGDNTGTLTIDASGGTNIRYALDDGDFSESNVFDKLTAGVYTITVKDEEGCIFSVARMVLSGMPFEEVKALISTNCTLSNCHDGSRAGLPNFVMDDIIVEFAEEIKKLTTNKSMPLASSGLTLSDAQIGQIACWVDDGALLN